MLRLSALCLACVVVATPMGARGDDASVPPAAAAPAMATPEDALAFLSNIRLTLPVEEAVRVEKMLRDAMAKNPGDMRWPAALAMLTRYKNGIDDALDLVRPVIEGEPTEANGWFALAVALSTGGPNISKPERAERSKAAIGALNHALQCDPVHPGALEMTIEYNTNVPASAGGDRARAVELAEQMMTLESVRWRAAELRARICMVSKDWDGVDKWFMQGSEWAPDPATSRELRRQQAMFYIHYKEDFQRAIDIATPFADPSAPDADRFSFVIGTAAYRLGNCDLAVTHDKRVLAAGDPPPTTLMELADCLERQGDLAGAAQALEVFATRFRGHPKEEEVLVSLNRLRRALKEQAADPTAPGAALPVPGAPAAKPHGE